MTDRQLDWVATLFIYNEVASRHGWTFEQFVLAYQNNQHKHLLEVAK